MLPPELEIHQQLSGQYKQGYKFKYPRALRVQLLSRQNGDKYQRNGYTKAQSLPGAQEKPRQSARSLLPAAFDHEDIVGS